MVSQYFGPMVCFYGGVQRFENYDIGMLTVTVGLFDNYINLLLSFEIHSSLCSMEPDTPVDISTIPVVPITESVKLKVEAVAALLQDSGAKANSSAVALADQTVEVPELAKLEVPSDVDPVEAKIAEQLATFRATPPAASPKVPLFEYHQGGLRSPVNLEFQEFEDPNSFIHIKLKTVESISKAKVKELGRLIEQAWGGAVNIDKRRKKGFEAHIYFLKYRRLEARDKKALEELRKVALNRGLCFIFVDEVFGRMHKVTAKLQEHSLLPPGAIFLPWQQDFHVDQLKALVGLTVSARFEDMTKSMRSINRVLIPPLPKKD